MKILFTIHSLKSFGGTESYTYTLTKELVKKGHEIYCFSLQLGEVAELMLLEGITVTDNLNNVPDDIEIIHGQHKLETILACSRFSEVPSIFISHGIIPWQEQPPKIGCISKYVAVSEEVRQHLIDRYKIKNNKIKIIRNGIDLSRFNKREDIQEKPSKLLLLSNRFNDELYQVISTVCKSLSIELSIVGQKGKKTWAVEEEINKADIVVSLGRGILEAAACERFAIIYDYNGGDGPLISEEYFKVRERNFSGRTKQEFYNANQLIALINSHYSIETVKENYKLIKENHDIKEIANQFVQLYNETINDFSQVNPNLYSFHSELNESLLLITKELDQKEKNITYILEVNNEINEENKNINNKIKELSELNNSNQGKINDMKREITILQTEKGNLKELVEVLNSEKSNIQTQINDLQTQLNVTKKHSLTLEKMNEEYVKQLDQKEANTKYLLELNQEKDLKLNEIYNSRVWHYSTKYRNYKNKFIKIVRNPKLVFKKLQSRSNSVELIEYQSNVSITNDENSPLISVVIPVYDRTEVLIESIESILNQSYQNFELIMVCDGSPQTTLDIVRNYEKHEKVRIFYYKNNSGNAVRGRNKAIKEAKGKYLAFQDSDDIATPDRLAISLAYITKHSATVVYGGWRALVDGTRNIDIKDGAEIHSPDCDYNMLQEICVPCQSTVMVDLEAVRRVGGLKTSMKYREDHELWLRLAYNGYKFKTIPEILTNLRLHESNLELTFKDTDEYWFNLMQEEHKKNTNLIPKIAYVIPGCGISGGIAVICQHVNRLLKRGFDVILISEDNNTSIDWFPNQLVEVLPMSEVPENLDIVVATGWSTAYTIKGINAKRKLYFVQSDESRFYEKNTKMYKEAWDSYKFDYEYMTEAKWIKNWLKDTFNQEAHYVPNGLDESIIHKTEPMVPKGEKVRVLLEGPIDIPFKGMKDSFMAINDLDCEVWCISSAGRPEPGWKCDRFFEKVPMEQMKYIYSSCDIFLKMSRVEGFFGPPLEMMACEGAVVVSKVTGYDEYIEHNYNALVVEPQDVEGAKKAVKKLIEDIELRNKLIANGKATADDWKWEPTIDTLQTIFLREG